MKKLLKVLAVVHFVLCAGALALGIELFNKRETLRARILKIEQAFIRTAAMLERQPAPADDKPVYPERDIDTVTSAAPRNPQTSQFWSGYRAELELEGPSVDLSGRKDQLRRVSGIDPVTGKEVIDGSGTMQEVLDEVVETAAQQRIRLDETRNQLVRTRQELVASIRDLNTSKQSLRAALADIVKRDGTMAEMEATLKSREAEMQARDEKIAMLDIKVRESAAIVAARNDDVADLKHEVASLEDIIERERRSGSHHPTPTAQFTEGEKGTVARVNREWNYVVLALSDDFVKEYAVACGGKSVKPDASLTIMRDAADGAAFVARVKLDDVYRERCLGVATILSDCRVAQIHEGDRVLY